MWVAWIPGFFFCGNISTAEIGGRVDRMKMAKVEWIELLCGGWVDRNVCDVNINKYH